MKAYKNFKAELSSLNSVEELRDRFSVAIKSLGYHGFDAFSVKIGTAENADQDCNLFVGDYGKDLLRSYVHDGWLPMDPAVAEVSRTSKPFDYVDFLRNAQKNTSVVWQLGILLLKNIHRAWLVPMCTVSQMRGMTVYMRGKTSGNEALFQQTESEIHLLCIEFMDKFVKLSNRKTEVDQWHTSDFDSSTVSQRETDCLHWAARGKTNWEIGKILEISENTVRYHLKNVFAKLHTSSRSSAVSRALSEGIIEL